MKSVVGNLQNPPTIDKAIRRSQVAVRNDLAVVQARHSLQQAVVTSTVILVDKNENENENYWLFVPAKGDAVTHVSPKNYTPGWYDMIRDTIRDASCMPEAPIPDQH